jgi:cytochrome b pre-mRNA-processing protein 3
VYKRQREERWYTRFGAPDTVDGRFDMVALVLSLVSLRLEAAGARAEGVALTERFVDDMDGSFRQIGIGDMVIGKHVGHAVGALGGRLGAYRDAIAAPDPEAAMTDAIARNVFRGSSDGDAAGLASEALRLAGRLAEAPIETLVAGEGL